MSARSRPFAYEFVDEADRRREKRLGLFWLPMTIGLLVSLLFIVITIVNFLASGIPDLTSGSTVWESDVTFPLIPLPSWLTIPVGFLPLLTAILIWPLVDRRHAPLVSNTILFTATVFLLLPIFFALAYSEPSPFTDGDRTIGWHWLAVPVVVVALIVLIVRRATLPPSPVPEAPEDPFFEEAVALRRRAQHSRRHRETLEADLADVAARRAAAGMTGREL